MAGPRDLGVYGSLLRQEPALGRAQPPTVGSGRAGPAERSHPAAGPGVGQGRPRPAQRQQWRQGRRRTPFPVAQRGGPAQAR